jgi:demethylmenaquinone methyltransferase/2-methoxy-6-polyprenyl-1,4-benzoquinol methylase
VNDEIQEYTRVNRPHSEAGEFYTRLSPWYDFLAASEKKFIRQGLKILAPKPGEKILEIGFGTGFAQLRIIPALEDGMSAALDLSRGMGIVAQKKIRAAGLAHLAGLVQSDTLPIPFQGQVFDGVFSSFTLELFDSPLIPQVLLECRRVLKSKGRAVFVSLSKDQPLTLIGKLYERLHLRYPKLLDCRPIPLQALVSEAGFQIQTHQPLQMWGLPVGILSALSEEY